MTRELFTKKIMKDETLIILVAVGIGYYLYSKSKTAAAAAATQTTVANPVGTIGTDVTTGGGLVGAVVGAYDQFFNGAASNPAARIQTAALSRRPIIPAAATVHI